MIEQKVNMKKILVVDDEEGLRSAIVAALRARGFDTVEADNGIDAFDLAKTTQPQLIISDVMMYSGSGFMLLEFLKRDDRTSGIPMILMTGHAQGAGAWGAEPEMEYLEKPFAIEELLTFVDKKLGA
jgi:CheY-like chemotaxis protein